MNCLSIIIPYYKGDHYYPALIASLKKAIGKYSGELIFEIVTIIDSVETDPDDVNVLLHAFTGGRDVKTIVHKNLENMGVAAARNVGISLASGDFFHIIDQDDEVSEDFYVTIVPLLSHNDFVLTNCLSKYTSRKYNSHLLYYIDPALNLKHLLTNEFIRSPGQVVFSERIAQNLKFPEPKLHKGADDRFFWIRLFLKNDDLRSHYIKEPLYIANIHDNNYSGDSLNLRKSSLENWWLLSKEINLLPYRKYVISNILSLKFSANEPMGLRDRIKGAFFLILNFLEPNKIIRFFYKRIR